MAAVWIAVATLAGCASTEPPVVISPENDLFHTNPSRRTAAIAVVERNRQAEFVPTLIEMLDDPDPAVRMVAAGTLEELTGRSVGAFRAHAPAQERRVHLEEWRAWNASRSGAATPTAPVAAPPDETSTALPAPPPPPDLPRGTDG